MDLEIIKFQVLILTQNLVPTRKKERKETKTQKLARTSFFT